MPDAIRTLTGKSGADDRNDAPETLFFYDIGRGAFAIEEEKRRQAEERKQERLKESEEKFIAGEFISGENFIGLRKLLQVPVLSLRTHGTLSKSVTELSYTAGIRYSRMKGQRSPKLNGCFALVRALHTKLTERYNPDI